jgi:hypothetical protein
MHREVLIACWPYAVAMLASVVALRGLIALSGARLQWNRLAGLHRDQTGAVQSLSFVLTLPLFIMVLLFIVQLSQLTICRVVMEYAAFAAARSAIVWIPANLGPGDEQENRISRLRYLGDVIGEDDTTYSEYEVEPEGPKFRKIHFAAAMACMPICPSRNVGQSRNHPGNAAAEPLIAAYHAYAPAAALNARIPTRIRHKLAYALNNTQLRIVIRHKDEEPELIEHGLGPYPEEFTANEIGWQDQIVVTVTHDFALLPGPGRLLARPSSSSSSASTVSSTTESSGTDRVSQAIGRSGSAFVYPVTATVRLGNEGDKPVLPYFQRIYFGDAPQDTGVLVKR